MTESFNGTFTSYTLLPLSIWSVTCFAYQHSNLFFKDSFAWLKVVGHVAWYMYKHTVVLLYKLCDVFRDLAFENIENQHSFLLIRLVLTRPFVSWGTGKPLFLYARWLSLRWSNDFWCKGHTNHPEIPPPFGRQRSVAWVGTDPSWWRRRNQ